MRYNYEPAFTLYWNNQKYSNDIAEGMSGGPVWDSSGKLVGINSKSKYPLGGIDMFKLADGSVPSQAVFRQMEALSWAIPIDTFQ